LVEDIRLGLEALAVRDPRDPWWVPAPLATGARPCRAAVFADQAGIDADPAVAAAVRKAAQLLENAGYTTEEIAPPRFNEAGRLFWSLLMTEERAASKKEMAASTSGIEIFGDEAVKRAREGTRAFAGELGFDDYIRGVARRTTILREWLVFLERYPLLVMPVSWQRPFVVDADQQGNDAMRRLIEAQFPMLAISILGLPSLAVPTGLVDGVPMGIQLVAGRYQEETCLAAGEVIEAQSSIKLPIDPIDR
jgi:amidase